MAEEKLNPERAETFRRAFEGQLSTDPTSLKAIMELISFDEPVEMHWDGQGNPVSMETGHLNGNREEYRFEKPADPETK